ncbi:hypothetical protein PsorP6_007326 [Peronosclerospora sorghi]|uniref:Uncharacterized protein n=1 Tax=Peronosclerospora sorghi TaxID=230839 RepID=A0ACC0WC18_9STRA|nr:hypothetical protein PsorP6_007326 [Peronosclerospora sorghi]
MHHVFVALFSPFMDRRLGFLAKSTTPCSGFLGLCDSTTRSIRYKQIRLVSQRVPNTFASFWHSTIFSQRIKLKILLLMRFSGILGAAAVFLLSDCAVSSTIEQSPVIGEGTNKGSRSLRGMDFTDLDQEERSSVVAINNLYDITSSKYHTYLHQLLAKNLSNQALAVLLGHWKQERSLQRAISYFQQLERYDLAELFRTNA